MEVIVKTEDNLQFYPGIKSVLINEDPDYNFDEANDGPYKWIELETQTFED